MNSGSIEYINLKELSNEDYKIIDGEAYITGWPVVDESRSSVGKVRDLLFDPEEHAVRYIIVDLDSRLSELEDKAILIPIGFANLGADKKEVVIPVLHENQYIAMPRYIIGEVTRATEVEIRSAIGSPAALRIEEKIAEMDYQDFYRHHHFDRGNVISRRAGSSFAENVSESASDNREEEQNTIHELINRNESGKSIEQEGGNKTTVKFEQFNVDTEAGIFTVEPQENGTYRILDGENKIGVIYAEACSEGTEWRTMDKLDDRLIIDLGQAITVHNHNT
ncbi:PRC-barrel domain-containing protein [Pedobacter rhodius]|uniref:PRC-barrel domain-containing protein n=1 Tax=Pedobacter rhodius TaxID=3004098 RepID=A0ABT4L0V7_9SPHI|nr:PRC-barrel domain-containing protein [Pedobacter sp. SJ11]MCZ4224810.1 PRC-barrel domain-containing protein [Pedobacter sp. SJ11]